MDKIKVVLAEDHHIVRTALAMLLSKEPDMIVVGEVSEGSNLLPMVNRLQPHVLVMDAQMPNHKPLEAVRALQSACPQTHIVILSAYDLSEYVVGLLQAGVTGYVLKDDPAEMLVEAVRAAAKGKEWVSPKVVKILVDSVRSNGVNDAVSLTAREREILHLIAIGQTNDEIAHQLFISEQTVKNHVSNLFRKMGVETRLSAVLYAIQHEIISLWAIKEELKAQ